MIRALYFALILNLCLAPFAAAEDDGSKKLEDFAELVAGATVREGLFDTYELDDHLYLAIPPERLGREFVMVPRIGQGIGASWLFTALMYSRLEANVVALERHGERVFLMQIPHRFTAEEGSPGAVAVDRCFGASVLAAAAVEALRDDGAIVVDIYTWVVSDLLNVEPWLRRAVAEGDRQRGVSFDASRSYLESVKAYPHNLEIRAKLTFRPSEPVTLDSVPDDRFLPLALHFSFVDLPGEPMQTRLADDRLGLIFTVRKDYSRRGDPELFMRIANRWRLEPGEKVGELFRPRKPLVYYLDHTIPEIYRPFVREGIEAWNEAFEQAGFCEAIRVEMLPEGAEPADVRYATVGWTATADSPFEGVGNEISDPRTGEMLDADVLIDAASVEGIHRQWRYLVEPRSDGLSGGVDHRGRGAQLAREGALLGLALAAGGELDADEPPPLEFLGQILRHLVVHEVGHTLGLDHNFRASAATPLGKLHDRSWTGEHGIGASVMDYLPVNLAPLGEPNGDFYQDRVGPYDRWAIAYLYTPDPERARALARQSADPFHEFGTDLDVYAPGALDPLTNLWDLSDDPLAWSRQRTQLIVQLLARLPELILTDDARYGELTAAVATFSEMYFEGFEPVVKYVGGQYVHRDHVGDPGARPPFVNVPKAKQREALAYLAEGAFSSSGFSPSPEILRQMGARHWDHWGHPGTFEGRIDPPYHAEILERQVALLEALTDPLRLARIRDAELKFGSAEVLSLPELMLTLEEAIWSEVRTPPGRNVQALRRDLQRAYLDRMATILLAAPARMPADARSVARQRLAELGRRLGKCLAHPESFDAYTLAHLEEAAARIDKILKAQLSESLP